MNTKRGVSFKYLSFNMSCSPDLEPTTGVRELNSIPNILLEDLMAPVWGVANVMKFFHLFIGYFLFLFLFFVLFFILFYFLF